MTDYGRPLEFGVSIDPTASDLKASLRLARIADETGLDHLAVQDHPYQPDHLDSWTLQTYLAASTERISVVGDVLDLQLRPPALLGKAAASLAVATGGRVTLGVGGGATGQGIAAMGGVPLPARPVEVWLGSQMPRMLAVTGRVADGWVSPLNIYVAPEEVPERQRIIDDAARAAKRDPRDVRRVYNVIGAIGPYQDGPGLVGAVDTWVRTLTDWALDLGFDTFIFWPVTDAESQLAAFARDVVPAVRSAVDAARAARAVDIHHSLLQENA